MFYTPLFYVVLVKSADLKVEETLDSILLRRASPIFTPSIGPLGNGEDAKSPNLGSHCLTLVFNYLKVVSL